MLQEASPSEEEGSTRNSIHEFIPGELRPLFDALVVMARGMRQCCAEPERWRPERKRLCVAGCSALLLTPLPPAFFLSVLCFVFITQQEPWGV